MLKVPREQPRCVRWCNMRLVDHLGADMGVKTLHMWGSAMGGAASTDAGSGGGGEKRAWNDPGPNGMCRGPTRADCVTVGVAVRRAPSRFSGRVPHGGLRQRRRRGRPAGPAAAHGQRDSRGEPAQRGAQAHRVAQGA
jgi:hypothetical protein